MCGFIEQKNRRVVDESSPYTDALAKSRGTLVNAFVQMGGEAAYIDNPGEIFFENIA